MDPVAVTSADLENSTSNSPALQDRGGYTIEYKHFAKGTPAEGFGYNTIQYTSIDAAKEKLGEKEVLAALNSALTSSLRVKAKSKLPENENEEERKTATAKMLADTGGVLLTEEEATSFVPGSREITSPATLQRLAKEASAAGDKNLARQYYKRALEIMQAQALAAVGSLEEDEDESVPNAVAA
jgi:hypothetical protein